MTVRSHTYVYIVCTYICLYTYLYLRLHRFAHCSALQHPLWATNNGNEICIGVDVDVDVGIGDAFRN